MKEFLIVISFFIVIGILSWIYDKIRQFFDTRNYLRKLNKLSLQINQIDVDELINKLDKIKKLNSFLIDNYAETYLKDNSDQLKMVDSHIVRYTYHVRSKRKLTRHGGTNKYYKYRRNY